MVALLDVLLDKHLGVEKGVCGCRKGDVGGKGEAWGDVVALVIVLLDKHQGVGGLHV